MLCTLAFHSVQKWIAKASRIQYILRDSCCLLVKWFRSNFPVRNWWEVLLMVSWNQIALVWFSDHCLMFQPSLIIFSSVLTLYTCLLSQGIWVPPLSLSLFFSKTWVYTLSALCSTDFWVSHCQVLSHWSVKMSVCIIILIMINPWMSSCKTVNETVNLYIKPPRLILRFKHVGGVNTVKGKGSSCVVSCRVFQQPFRLSLTVGFSQWNFLCRFCHE